MRPTVSCQHGRGPKSGGGQSAVRSAAAGEECDGASPVSDTGDSGREAGTINVAATAPTARRTAATRKATEKPSDSASAVVPLPATEPATATRTVGELLDDLFTVGEIPVQGADARACFGGDPVRGGVADTAVTEKLGGDLENPSLGLLRAILLRAFALLISMG
jgi:hypothetical protein